MNPKKLKKTDQAAFQELKRAEDLIKKNRSDREAYLLLLKSSKQLGLLAKAVEYLEKAIQSFPKESFFYLELGNLYLTLEKDILAMNTFEMIFSINKREDSFYKTLIDLYIKNEFYEKLLKYFYHIKGIIPQILEDSKAQIKKQRKFLKALLSTLERKPKKKTLCNAINTILDQESQLVGSTLDQFSLIVQKNPNDENIFENFYQISHRFKIYDRGVDLFLEQLHKNPSNIFFQKYLTLFLSSEKDHKKAISIFSNLVDIHPHIVNFYLSLANHYMLLDKMESALKTLKKARIRIGRNDSIFLLMGEIHLAQKNYADAINFCEKFYYNMNKPQKLKLLEYRALLGLNKKKKALEIYQQMSIHHPEELASYSGIYELACELKDYKVAIQTVSENRKNIEKFINVLKNDHSLKDSFALFEELFNRFSENTYVQHVFLNRALEQKHYQIAFFLIESLIRKKPENTKLLKKALDIAVKADNDQKIFYFIKKLKHCGEKLEGSFQDFFLRTHNYVGAVENSELMLLEYHQIYKMALASHKVHSSVEVLEEALKNYPDDQLTMNYIVKHYKKLDKTIELANIYKKMSKSFTTAKQYHDWILLEQQLFHHETALKILKKALKKYPDNLDLSLLLGKTLKTNKALFLKSHLFYLKSYEKFPDKIEFIIDLADIYSEKNNKKKALFFYQKAITLDNSLKKPYLESIKILKEQGEEKKIFTVYQQALQFLPNEIVFYIGLAELYEKNKELSRAIQVYKEALKISPGDELCYRRLFNLYCKIKDFLSALRICSQDKNQLLKLYQMSISQKNESATLEILKKATRFFPKDFEFHEYRAQLLYKQKQIEASHEILEKMLSIKSKHRPTYINLFHLKCQMNNFESALDLYVKASRLFPSDEEFPLKIASIHYKLGRYNKAIEYYKKVIKINPLHKSVFEKLASLYRKMKLFNEAILVYKNAIKQFPHETLFYEKAVHLLEKLNSTDNAIAIVKQALKKHPKNITFWKQLSGLYKKKSSLKDSVSCYYKAIHLDKNNKNLYLELSEIYFHFEKDKECIHLLKNILRRWPNYREAYEKIFDLYCSKQKYTYAAQFFKELVSLEEDSLESNNILPYLYLFKVYYKQESYSKAIKFLESSLLCFPEDISFLKKLAGLSYKIGKVSEALIYLKKALSIRFADKEIFRGLFTISLKSGHLKEAMKFYKQALLLWPESKREFTEMYRLTLKVSREKECTKQILKDLIDDEKDSE